MVCGVQRSRSAHGIRELQHLSFSAPVNSITCTIKHTAMAMATPWRRLSARFIDRGAKMPADEERGAALKKQYEDCNGSQVCFKVCEAA